MGICSKYVNNDNIFIHYLECGHISEDIPSLLYVPGLLGTAEQFSDEFKEFLPRHCISISLRGRGKSSAPKSGYSFEEHCSDIVSVIEHAHLEQFYIVCHSAGVPFSLEVASRYKEKIKGLVLCDYPPYIPSFSPDWLSNILLSSNCAEPLLKALVNELKPTDVSDKLNYINAPVLVLQGKKTGAKLTDNDKAIYERELGECHIIVFKESGHELWFPNYHRFIDTVREFMNN